MLQCCSANFTYIQEFPCLHSFIIFQEHLSHVVFFPSTSLGNKSQIHRSVTPRVIFLSFAGWHYILFSPSSVVSAFGQAVLNSPSHSLRRSRAVYLGCPSPPQLTSSLLTMLKAHNFWLLGSHWTTVIMPGYIFNPWVRSYGLHQDHCCFCPLLPILPILLSLFLTFHHLFLLPPPFTSAVPQCQPPQPHPPPSDDQL